MDPTIDFFISYASRDEEWARAIDRWLNAWGYRTWIAARDERGRWWPELERALAGSRRLLALLSPAYEASEWCEREWKAMAERDQDGIQDLVVVVRIAEGRQDSPLRAFHWVDGVDVTREQLRDRLEQRIRRTDASSPRFQSTATSQVHDDDAAALRTVQEAVARWREQLGPRVAAVETLRDRIRRWRRQEETPTDEALAEAADVGTQLGAALRKLPVHDLTPALRFGLAANPMLVQHGTYLDIAGASRDDYDLECLGRVFDAALAIARFDDAHMPRGLADVPIGRLEDLPDRPLFLMTGGWRDQPRVFAVDRGIRWLGTFHARAHGVSLLCASRDRHLHVVGVDGDDVVVWTGSQIVPSAVTRHGGRVIAATMWGAEALLVDDVGRIFTVGPKGKGSEYRRRPPGQKKWDKASVRAGTADLAHAWLALADREVLSYGTARAETGRLAIAELAARCGVESPLPDVISPTIAGIEASVFAGRPALLVEWGFGILAGAAFTVHSAEDLQLLHRPIAFGRVAGASLLGGRYLIVSRLSEGSARDSIAIFDLTDPSEKPSNDVAFGRYEAYGFHAIADADPASCLFALRDFEASDDQQYRLSTLEYAEGTLRTLATFPNIRLLAVTEAVPR